MYGNYYCLNIENRRKPLTKEFCSDMRSLVRVAKEEKIRCAFVHDETSFTLKFTGGNEEPLNFESNCYSSMGISDSGGLRTHPCDNNFDSVVKAGLMVCQKHNLVDCWCTDGGSHDSEWELAKKLASKIGLDCNLYLPKTSVGTNGFMHDKD